MNKLVIHGSHFGGVLEAVKSMLIIPSRPHSRSAEDVELVCDDEEEIYILREIIGKYVITTIPY